MFVLKTKTPSLALVGAPFDEIIVESSLNVRPKPEPARRKTRGLTWNVIYPEHIRYQRIISGTMKTFSQNFQLFLNFFLIFPKMGFRELWENWKAVGKIYEKLKINGKNVFLKIVLEV